MLASAQRLISARTSMVDRFGRYKPESSHEVRQLDIKNDQTLQQLTDAWLKFSPDFHLIHHQHPTALQIIADLVKDINYSSKDVEKFSIALAAFQDEEFFQKKAGLFLSVLINHGKDKNYTISVQHLQVKIDYLCMQNTKHVTIYGDAGHWCATGMRSGSILIKGNPAAASLDISGIELLYDNNYLGKEMSGGKIIVESNVGHDPGQGMKGGTIIIKGNSWGAGQDMEDGLIIIEGNIKIHYVGWKMQGGKIIVKGNVHVDVGPLMEDGIIVICGNTYLVGSGMHGGVIYLKGGCKGTVGSEMYGGEVHVFGDEIRIAEDPTDFRLYGVFWGGRIFHNNRLIVDKPKCISPFLR